MSLLTLNITNFTCADLHVTIYEEWQKLLLNGRSVPLTPTEYRLCAAFFQQWLNENREPIMNNDGLVILSYLNATELQTQASLASRQLLRKHISNANGKLAPFTLHIKAFEKGYIFLITTAQQSKPTAAHR